jgi:outer membrane protein OmpA-like peptidoglycan-associated protein
MKRYFTLPVIMLCMVQMNVQRLSAQVTIRNPNRITCYQEYHDAFEERGATTVTDGEQRVVVSLRKDTSCICGEGKVMVEGGRIIPLLQIKKIDGTYEPAKKKLHSSTWKEEAHEAERFDIVNGMSPSFRTDDEFVADLFFIDFLKRKVVPNAPAPKPGEISGVQIELNEKEKEVLRQAYEGLQFETGKAVIKKESFSHLNLLATMLLEKPDYKLSIRGHTDNVGNAESNLTLSINRAENVKSYLMQKGIMVDRIVADGFGMEQPIADNKTAEGRAKNRRVEFIVFK